MKLEIKLQKLERALVLQCYMPNKELNKNIINKFVDNITIQYKLKSENIKRTLVFIESSKEDLGKYYDNVANKTQTKPEIYKITIYLNINRSPKDSFVIIPTKNNKIRDKIYFLISESLKS